MHTTLTQPLSVVAPRGSLSYPTDQRLSFGSSENRREVSRSAPIRDRVGNEWVRDAVGGSFTKFAKSAACVGANAKSQFSERSTDGPPDGSKSRFYGIQKNAVAALPAARFRRNSASEELIWTCLRSPSLSCSGHREVASLTGERTIL